MFANFDVEYWYVEKSSPLRGDVVRVLGGRELW